MRLKLDENLDAPLPRYSEMLDMMPVLFRSRDSRG
jgi:hypothetical protein